MKILFSVILLFSSCFSLQAQDLWDFDRCVDRAIDKNFRIAQGRLSMEERQIWLTQSKLSRLPSLNAGFTENFNFGRAINPFTNTFETEKTTGGSIYLGSTLTIFNGLQKVNQAKQNEYLHEASVYDYQTTVASVISELAPAYLELIMRKEGVETTKNAVLQSKKALDRTQTLFDEGATNKGTLLNIKADYANQELNLINAENAMLEASLRLRRYLLLSPTEPFEIDYSVMPNSIPSKVYNVEEVFNSAMKNRPEIKSEMARLDASRRALSKAIGARAPTLNLNANLSTIYSDRAFSRTPNGEIIVNEGLGVTASGERVDFFSLGFEDSDIPAGEQFSNNLGYAFSFGLNIPIFNGGQIHSSVKAAELALKRAELQLQDTEMGAYQLAATLVNQYNSAKKTFEQNTFAHDAQKTNFDFSTIRFDEGLMNSVDYLSIKNNYEMAKANLLFSKYDLLLDWMMLEYFLDSEISFKDKN